MGKSRLKLDAGVWLDARRAIWFEHLSLLAVADLHIGYSWVHRHEGQMLPLHQPDDTAGRLGELCDFYKPLELLLLGDIVHRALPLPQIETQLKELFDRLEGTRLRLIAGNHDRHLDKLVSSPLQTEHTAGPYVFVHGHLTAKRRERIVMGHEHPAISIGDGITTSVKCPCFLISQQIIVLPAFSLWAAGGVELALGHRFDTAVAILGDKLLPIALNKR